MRSNVSDFSLTIMYNTTSTMRPTLSIMNNSDITRKSLAKPNYTEVSKHTEDI